jgi:hypothetical protein
MRVELSKLLTYMDSRKNGKSNGAPSKSGPLKS